MKEKIIKAKTCKTVSNKDDVHLRFHTLVDERLTKIFGDVSAAPVLIGQAWTRLKEALTRQRLKYTMWDRLPTPQLTEARKCRDDQVNDVIRMADALAGDKSDAELQYLGRYLQLFLKRSDLKKNLNPDAREVYTWVFCHWKLKLPEYIAAVQGGKIKPVVEELNQINKECDKMLHERLNQLNDEIPEDMKVLRKQTTAAYRDLTAQTNEALLELTLLTKPENREQASLAVDIAAAAEDKERIVALVSLLNDDVNRYELQVAEARQKKKDEAEARKKRKEQAMK